MEVRGKAISYSSFKHKERNNREQSLIKDITDLEQNIDKDSTEKLENIKTELYDIRQEKLKGHIIRSRAQYIDQSEKPTKYFCGLEKHNYVSKTMSKLEKNDGSIITEQTEILNETEKYYKSLYANKDNTLDDIDLNQYIGDNEIPKLNDDQAYKLEGTLTYKEISSTLYRMKNDKSPGLSGFSAEFFKVFWKQLGHFVLRSINYGYQKGELSITQRQGIITCIPKENKPKQLLKNWRPLTLLDTVYKIASGSIAERLKSVLDSIINKDQTGFIQGRYIGENTRLIYDLMNYTEQMNIPGLLLLIDFEKAFDSLSWSFMQKAMKFLNFGESIRRWIGVFYRDISSAVIQGGHLSNFFKIGRGCRQGDPLSPYIFIICAEFLSNKIRKNRRIKGIIVNNTELKISQFADDTSLILDGSEESLHQTLEELEKFATISGLKINFEKTQLVWIGSRKFDTNTIKTKWKLSWGKQTFRLLGINFNTDLQKMIKENYTTKIEHLENMIKQWQKRTLTPLGKITVIKTLMIPAFNHLFISLPNPDQAIINHINNILFTFLWNSKIKIRSSVIVKEYCDGGLKMVNLKVFIDALKSTWLRRILVNNCKWQAIVKTYVDLNKLTGCHIKYIEEKMKDMKNQFWKDVFQTLISLNEKTDITEESLLKCPIFYNNNIQVGGKAIYYNTWYNKGVRYLTDLVNDNGELYSQEEFSNITGIQTNYLQYYGTIQAIKSYIKHTNLTLHHKEQYPFIPSHICFLLKQNKGSRTMYNVLNQNREVPTGKLAWNKIYNINEDDWKQIYMYPFRITKYSAVRWFQINIIHNILVTNKLLFQMKIKNNFLCSFCQEYEETTTHLLWKCCKTQQFIKELIKWLQTFNIQCFLSEELFLFGLIKDNIITNTLNFIILYAKYYIYCSRCNNQALILNVFKKKLLFMYKIHMEIAFSNNDMIKFQNERSPFQTLINDIRTNSS